MKTKWYKIYAIIMSALAIISVLLLIGDYNYWINITEFPWSMLNYSIWIIFVVDYFTRLHFAKHKTKFIIHNVFDLLSIIPFDILSSFRIFRAVRVLRIFRAFRMVGFIGRLVRNVKRFLEVTKLDWVALISAVLVLLSALIFSLAERVSFNNALWWAIVTTTTVGYGDITPRTIIGRGVAVFLMLTGIGVVGILTSSITNYFSSSNRTSDSKNDRIDKILKKLNYIQNEIDNINKK